MLRLSAWMRGKVLEQGKASHDGVCVRVCVCVRAGSTISRRIGGKKGARGLPSQLSTNNKSIMARKQAGLKTLLHKRGKQSNF
eukprot:4846429-Amphidinium_carterae.1